MKRKASNYDAWLINKAQFPSSGSLEEQIQFISEYGILAPSTHNSQPWVITVAVNRLKIEPDRSKKLHQADPKGRNLCISLGACAFNILVAAAYFDFSTKLSIKGKDLQRGSIEIEFESSNQIDKNLVKLFPELIRRYSDKRTVIGKPISVQTLNNLQQISDSEVKIQLTTDKQNINDLAQLGFKAAASYATNPLFGRELANWLRGNNTKKFDGMPGFMSGLSKPKAIIGKSIVRIAPKSLKVMAKKYLKMVQTSSGVGIVTTIKDDWKSWIYAGLAYEKLALIASQQQLSISPAAALIEHPVRSQLNSFFVESSGYPQMFFRVIQAAETIPHSPRYTPDRKIAELALLKRLRQDGLEIAQKSIISNGYRINYIAAGAGSPLLLIHGANIGWGQWLPNLSELSRHFRVIALDLPGCGGSSAIDFRKLDLGAYVHTVADFLNQLGIHTTAVIGHSFGATIAIKLAAQSDVSITKVLLVNPLGFSQHVPLKQKLATFYPLAKIVSKTAVKPTRKNMKNFLAEPMVNTDVVTEELVDYFWTATTENNHNHPLLFMNSLTNSLVIKPELLLINKANQLKQPLFIVAGDKDPLIPLTKLTTSLKHVPNAKIEVFNNTGHVASLEQSKKFNEAALNFLK